MGKTKADLLVEANELNLEVTEENTVAEIKAAIDGVETDTTEVETENAIVAENTEQLTPEQKKAGWFVSEWGELRAPTVFIGGKSEGTK